MSFYQPSLSLFDVLNALSDRAPPRNPPFRPNNGGPHERRHAYGPQNLRHSGMGPFHGPYPMGRNGFFNPTATGGPLNVNRDDDGFPGGAFFYGHPFTSHGDNYPDYYYYIPQFSEDDEDENENEGEELHDNNEDGEKVNEGNNDVSKETGYPSYYHTKDGNNRFRMMNPPNVYLRGPESRDYLNDLFDTFFGAPRGRTEQRPEQQEEKKSKALSGEETMEDKTSEEVNPNTTPDENNIKQDKTENVSDSATNKPPLKKNNSNAFIPGPFAIPSTTTTGSDPLKVSKPEIRMDLPFTPEVNVYDLKTKYIVVLALPGSNSKAFKVDYHPTTHELTVRGTLTDKLGVDEKYLKLSEIKYGAFERTVKFPILPRIKDEEIKAKYSNGLLQINVPKMDGPQDKPVPKKRITIEEIPDAELEFEKNPNPVEKN